MDNHSVHKGEEEGRPKGKLVLEYYETIKTGTGTGNVSFIFIYKPYIYIFCPTICSHELMNI